MMNDCVHVTNTVVHMRGIAGHVRGMMVCVCCEHSGACERSSGA